MPEHQTSVYSVCTSSTAKGLCNGILVFNVYVAIIVCTSCIIGMMLPDRFISFETSFQILHQQIFIPSSLQVALEVQMWTNIRD